MMDPNLKHIGIALCKAKRNSKGMKKGDSLAVLVYSEGFKINKRGEQQVISEYKFI